MLFTFVAKIINNYRCSLGNFVANRAFAVKYSHRISVKPAFASVAKLVLARGKIFFECLVIFGTAGRTAD